MPEKGTRYPPKRSAGALQRQRARLGWPRDRDFRILSLDGGGIRGVYSAAFLAGLERRYLGGRPIAPYFDLVAGTSTGGILALGLAAGHSAADLLDLYIRRGKDIFPARRNKIPFLAGRWRREARQYFRYRYDRTALKSAVEDILGDRRFGEAQIRLCIPAFDGKHSEVYIFKTPHHPDFRNDAHETMTKIALATSAAPTFFRPLRDGGYTFVDGGIWANNPVMVGLVDALSCFSLPRRLVRILSVGTGDEPYTVGDAQIGRGGKLAWRYVIKGALRLQSLNAVGQAGLLIGSDRLLRVTPGTEGGSIDLDDWERAILELVPAANRAVEEFGPAMARSFLQGRATPYAPFVNGSRGSKFVARTP